GGGGHGLFAAESSRPRNRGHHGSLVRSDRESPAAGWLHQHVFYTGARQGLLGGKRTLVGHRPARNVLRRTPDRSGGSLLSGNGEAKTARCGNPVRRSLDGNLRTR